MHEKKRAFLITGIEEYGKLISFCIRKDINVWRTYWNEREKGDRCYHLDWKEKRCYYSSRSYYEINGYEIIVPTFQLDRCGKYDLI